jgi:hypothetical protein
MSLCVSPLFPLIRVDISVRRDTGQLGRIVGPTPAEIHPPKKTSDIQTLSVGTNIPSQIAFTNLGRGRD